MCEHARVCTQVCECTCSYVNGRADRHVFVYYLHLPQCKNRSDLVWVPPEADLETKVQVQLVSLGGDPRGHEEGSGREEVSSVPVIQPATTAGGGAPRGRMGSCPVTPAAGEAAGGRVLQLCPSLLGCLASQRAVTQRNL